MNVPGEQGELDVEPVEHAEPAGHEVQSEAAASPVLLEYVPARHGSCADAPRGQKLPRSQVTHAVLLVAPVYFPAGHRSHTPSPAPAANAPGRHGVHAPSLSLPGTGLALPAGHERQDTSLGAPRSGLYVPAGHWVKAMVALAAPSEAQ